MLDLARKQDDSALLRNDIAARLYDIFSAEDSALASLDRWTQRRVIDENMAKVSLVLESEDPVETCYQNLIREIDTEAESGVFLIGTAGCSRELRDLAMDPGISGTLNAHMDQVAPVMFPDELTHSYRDMDLVWVTINARYDRAKIDATVSEMIMAHLQEDAAGVHDMTDALRSLMYSFHEDLARRLSNLPLILNDRGTRELVTMISELADRAGSYEQRVSEITERAGTA